MNEQLDRAYQLIKDGETEEALQIITPIIRTDRNNEDAWWLFANAATDPEAKRNALNNVIRITENEARLDKARTMLQSLDADHYDFDAPAKEKTGMSAYQEIDTAPQKKSGRFSCATLSLVIVGLIGACALVSCFGIYALMGDFFSFINAPTTYDDRGVLSSADTYSGSLTLDEPTDAYIYNGQVGDRLDIRLEADSETAPFVIIYDLENEILVSIGQPQPFSSVLATSFTLPASGDYMIAVRSIELLGTEFGYSDYTLEFEVQ